MYFIFRLLAACSLFVANTDALKATCYAAGSIGLRLKAAGTGAQLRTRTRRVRRRMECAAKVVKVQSIRKRRLKSIESYSLPFEISCPHCFMMISCSWCGVDERACPLHGSWCSITQTSFDILSNLDSLRLPAAAPAQRDSCSTYRLPTCRLGFTATHVVCQLQYHYKLRVASSPVLCRLPEDFARIGQVTAKHGYGCLPV